LNKVADTYPPSFHWKCSTDKLEFFSNDELAAEFTITGNELVKLVDKVQGIEGHRISKDMLPGALREATHVLFKKRQVY
jgi:hypothetical protein